MVIVVVSVNVGGPVPLIPMPDPWTFQ